MLNLRSHCLGVGLTIGGRTEPECLSFLHGIEQLMPPSPRKTTKRSGRTVLLSEKEDANGGRSITVEMSARRVSLRTVSRLSEGSTHWLFPDEYLAYMTEALSLTHSLRVKSFAFASVSEIVGEPPLSFEYGDKVFDLGECPFGRDYSTGLLFRWDDSLEYGGQLVVQLVPLATNEMHVFSGLYFSSEEVKKVGSRYCVLKGLDFFASVTQYAASLIARVYTGEGEDQ